MAIKFNRSQTFATNGTVTAAGLHNLVDGLDIYQALITDQTNLTSVGTADELLIADADLTANDAPRAVTVQELFNDALTVGTYTDANFTANLTYGTATGNRTVSTNASITTGTINNATLGTTTGTLATFTNGTVQTLTSSTATITGGIFSGSVNSTVGTIGNFSTTLAGDVTISQGTATLGTSGVTAGTYGTGTTIPVISVNAKGLITTVSTSAVTPANASVTPAMLSQPLTLASAVASTSGTAIDFTGIPSWAKRVTVMLNGVSTNGSSLVQVQLGSGSIKTSGYTYYGGYAGSANQSNATVYTSGFVFEASAGGASGYLRNGIINIIFLSSNTWVCSISGGFFTSTAYYLAGGGGNVSLSGALDSVRITTIGGTETFDAGTINIIYEG